MPSSIEDLLIKKYHKDYPGKIYKEVSVGKVENKMRQRRIDAILIEGKENEIIDQGEYNLDEVRNEIMGEKIHLIEAKRSLGRYVIGQIEVGEYLVENDFKPNKVISVALCANSHPDIEKYCELKNIKVEIYNINIADEKDCSKNPSKNIKNENNNSNKIAINDGRKPPDRQRFIAFKRGWKDATKGKLYDSVNNKKTHTNMGNLFGWIYGECPEEMKKRVWEQYIKNNREYLGKEW